MTHTAPTWRAFLGRLILLACFLLPLGYVGIITGVVIHEVLGHGGMALLVGGRFDGFVIRPDGMGWSYAFAQDSAATWRTVLVLMAGSWATTLTGLLLVAVAWRIVTSPWWRLALYGLGMAILLDSYALWSAWAATGAGDAAVVISLTGSQALRWGMMIGGATVVIFGAWFPLRGMLATAEPWLSQGQVLSRSQHAVVLASFITTIGMAYYCFDYNELVPGVGKLPAHCQSTLTVAVGVWLFFRWPRNRIAIPSSRGIVAPLAVAWALAFVTLAVTYFWLSHGEKWA